MDPETHSLFARVSERLGWGRSSSDLAAEEERLRESVKKNEKALDSRSQPALSLDMEDLDSPIFVSCSHRLLLSGSDSDTDFSLKEKKPSASSQKCQKESARFMFPPVEKTAPRSALQISVEELAHTGGKRKGKVGMIKKKQESVPVVISDSSDDDFEMFLSQLKTPKSGCPEPKNLIDDLKDFIVDSDEEFTFDFNKGKGASSKKGLKNGQNQGTPTLPVLLKRSDSPPVFDSSDESSNVVKSTWRDRRKAKTKERKEIVSNRPASADCGGASRTALPIQSKTVDQLKWAAGSQPALQRAASWAPASRASQECDSSEDEFESLMVRIKNRGCPQTPTSTAKKNFEEGTKGVGLVNFKPVRDIVNGTGKKTQKSSQPKTKSLPKEGLEPSPSPPTWSPPPPIAGIGDMGPPLSSLGGSSPCRVPNCFLADLCNSTSPYVKNFKVTKHELTQRLFAHFNSTIFDLKLPENLEIIWNKKMRKTAGYCVTGQRREPEGQRYARIELSDKVCDSADRLRDTLIHEICHAATWLINAVRDGHGQFWRCYARKSTVIHPELPIVSRCHSYDINYKFTYQCSRCTTTIGRHSKSLDTQRFVCALCQGPLVLVQPAGKNGTTPIRKLTPFASFVKENYGSTKKASAGLSHAEVMRKLSSDFSAKAQITAS